MLFVLLTLFVVHVSCAADKLSVAVFAPKAFLFEPKHHLIAKSEFKNRMQICSEINGKISSINVKEGDQIKQNDILFTLKDDGRSSALTSARKMLNLRQMEYKNNKALKNNGDVSYVGMKLASANLAEARMKVDQAENLLEKTHIRSPMNGQVLHIHAKVGSTIAAGCPRASQIDVANNEIQFIAYASKYNTESLIKNNDAIIKYHDHIFNGRIDNVSQDSNDRTGTYKIKILPIDTMSIRDGEYVHIDIPHQELTVHQIPYSALEFSESGRPQIKLLCNDQVDSIQLEIIDSNDLGIISSTKLPDGCNKIVDRGHKYLSKQMRLSDLNVTLQKQETTS